MFSGKEKIRLRIVITNSCNLYCKGCFNEWENDRGNRFVDIKDTIKKIKSLKFSIDSIKITGGEPLLHPNIGELCQELSKISEVSITTNGTLLSEKLHLIPPSIPITFSLYGITQEEFIEYTQTSSKLYQKLNKQLALIGNITDRMFYANIIIQDNIEWDFYNWLDFVFKYNFKKVRFISKLDTIINKKIYQRNLETIENYINSKGSSNLYKEDPSIIYCHYNGRKIELIRQYREFNSIIQKKYGFIWLNIDGNFSEKINEYVFLHKGFKK
jgi:molybdenum cofactor biosynthesis enzyme MoaA